jgi:hypothetical protein
LKEAFQQEDGVLTYWHASFVEKGICGFESDEKKSNELYFKMKSQPISDSTIFMPYPSDLSNLKDKW